MPKVVVRKGYRCQPGKRREVLAALQRIDAAAAAAGYPRGRYLLVETRAPGEPDLEVEFTFESYAEMEGLERRMREHVARFLREGGSTGQELLLEPSATRYLLLLEEGPASAASTAGGTLGVTASQGAPPARPSPPTRSPAATASPPVSASPSRPAAPAAQRPQTAEPPPWMAEPDEEDDAFDRGDLPEPEVPPPPAPPLGMSDEQFQAQQRANARAALQNAERTVNLQPKPPGQPARRPARPPAVDE